MVKDTFSEVWDLEVLFKGGSESEEFSDYLIKTSVIIDSFKNSIEAWEETSGVKELNRLLSEFENAAKHVRQAGAFVSCLQAQDTFDGKAGELKAKVMGISAKLKNALLEFDHKLSGIPGEQWTYMKDDPLIRDLRFILEERRERAQEKLGPHEEALITSLSVDGYHSWNQLYDLLVSSVKVKCQENEEIKFLSVGQAANLFAHRERAVRKSTFAEWEKAWGEKEEIFAKTLNHLAGYRLTVYEKRGWSDVLKEPLDMNRMKKETLDAMWAAITDMKQPFVEFLNRKAKLLGVHKLSWYDLDAPLGKIGERMSFQQGGEFIISQFSEFGKEMSEFANKAFKDRWIEAEDRHGKAPGGFHTYFPDSGQSRIFMTYSGTPANVSTLAHELGHGFHTYAMRGIPMLNRDYAMNVAETASTFAEMIVSDAAVRNSKTREEKLGLLEDKIQRSVALLMNIHSRFIFEKNFYEERRQGMVSTDRLNHLMKKAQEEAYGGALEEYHPLFWASKLHFYLTGVPFYNFPYTFGFLFSLGIYANAREEGEGFEQKYMALLKDSASMTVEELAMKHLGADLTKKDFWSAAVKLCVEDVQEFLELTK